jgi:SNF2 family DNA or RNA helicase
MWQKDHAGNLREAILNYGYAKDGSDTGTGKTVVALSVAKDLGLTPFVVCPKSVVPSWKEWAEKFEFPPFVFNYEKLIRGKTEYYTRKGSQRVWSLHPERVLLIFDEDHRCKGAKSENAKMMIAAKKRGLLTLSLGATSCANPIEMRALGYLLDLHDDRGWWNWCLKNGCKRGTFGGLAFTGNKSALKRIHDHIYKLGRGSRLRIRDLPPGSFPNGNIISEGYDVGSAAEIEDIYNDLKVKLEEIDTFKMDADNPLTVQLRARQEVELLKVPVLEELARDALEGDNSVVIFVNFRDTLEALLRRLSGSHEISVIDGSQSGVARDKEVKRFQNDESRICLCMTQAGGTGLNLHDENGKHPRVSLISPSFSAIDLKQALGRIHRAGAKSPAVQKIVFADNTVEMRVCRLVRKKLNSIDLINDDEMNPLI